MQSLPRGAKKSYNKLLDKTSKLQKAESKCWFLKECIAQKVFPKTLRSKPNYQENWSSEAIAKEINNKKTAALNSTKIALAELIIQKTEIKNAHDELFDEVSKNLTLKDKTILVQRCEKK